MVLVLSESVSLSLCCFPKLTAQYFALQGIGVLWLQISISLITHDTKAIIWHISLIANIFEWTENLLLPEASTRHASGNFNDSIFQLKRGLSFPLRKILKSRTKYLGQTHYEFFCEIAHYGKGSISIFREFCASIDKF